MQKTHREAGVVSRISPFPLIGNNMIKAFSGALSLALTLLVLRLALPEVLTALTEIMLKLLALANSSLDLATSQPL